MGAALGEGLEERQSERGEPALERNQSGKTGNERSIP